MGFFRRMLFLLSFFLGLFLTLSSGCQNIGNECWSSTNGAAAGGCCDGTQCGPWSPNNEPWDGSSAWYCLSMPRIASGGTCNYDTKNGLCVEGTYCCNGVCSSSCTSTTTSSTTTTSTTSTSTTTEQCTAQPRNLCVYDAAPAGYPQTCCPPYTCETIQTGIGMCTGTNLPEGSECWTDANTAGTCADGLQCINNVCTVFQDNAACLEAGIAGFNICRIGAINQDVPQECCNPTPSGSTKVFCLPSTDPSVTDKFCMEYGIAKDQPCGTTAEYNHLGYCDVGTDCINGVCSATTTTTTTSTSTTSTTTLECIADGAACWENMALVNQGICCSTGQTCDVQNPMMTTNC